MHRHRIMPFAVSAGLMLVLNGCSEEPTRYEAGGTVTFDSKPVENATLAFVPDAGLAGQAQTDKDGKYKITSVGKPGLPAGKYKVSIKATTGGGFAGGTTADEKKEKMMDMMMKGPKDVVDVIPPKYSDPQTSGLTAEVTSDPKKNVFDFSLKN